MTEASGRGQSGELDATLEAAARRHRVLAEPVRLRLLHVLAPRPRSLSVGEVAASLGVSVGAASRHVMLLAQHGFVERSRSGMYVCCRLTTMGETVVRRALNPAVGGGHAGNDMSLDGPLLAEEDGGAVQVYLALGVSMLRRGGRDRATWNTYMVREFGDAIRPHLDLLRAAVLCIARQESFEHLPLPVEIHTEGIAAYAGLSSLEAGEVPLE